ncbi:MCE family protein [Saccharopolyspora sp. HNM0983]|uniref:MCE family protein n=1 Tax=Saccharopolyspora montiporae TaxID=2781240 RepID=A0A929BDE8_9PSEU|nr:MCE family protein [Saccharopolyspora sp. HNM0983]MBE9375462.1 MCE family protein [Saccharopolyspora sp. HNM0983]
MKRIEERSKPAVGVVTLALIITVCVLAFFGRDLPVVGTGTGHEAYFAESAGLKPGNDVQVAGVKAGEVTGVELDGKRVLVDFRVEDARLGQQTRAGIEIKTLLGEKMLVLEPKGTGDLDEPIPVERTTAPFDIPDALDELTRTTEQLDTEQLAESFRTVSDTFRGADQHLGPAVEGLADLSETVASRDEQLGNLLQDTEGVTRIVAERDEQVSRLISDGNVLLEELQQRRQAIHELLTGTERLSRELRGLVADHEETLKPALQKMDQLTGMLSRNRDNIDKVISSMAPYVRGFNNTVGNGRWFDGYICGLLPPPVKIGPVETNTDTCELPVPQREVPAGGQ